MPLHMRLPKLPGFRNPGRVEYAVVNLDSMDLFEDNEVVDPDKLRSKGLVPKKGFVKVLGGGGISKPLTVKAHAFSKTAVSKITSAGGTTQTLS